MEDTIEICSGCGKMPRALDNASGHFFCSRCGNRSTQHVNADDYEQVVTGLDQRFHMHIQKRRIEAAASSPVDMKKRRGARKVRKKASRKPARKPVKKASRKKKPARRRKR